MFEIGGANFIFLFLYLQAVDPSTNQLVLRPTVDGVTLNGMQYELFKYNIATIESRIDLMKTDYTVGRMEYELDDHRSIIVKKHLGHIIIEFTSSQADRVS